MKVSDWNRNVNRVSCFDECLIWGALFVALCHCPLSSVRTFAELLHSILASETRPVADNFVLPAVTSCWSRCSLTACSAVMRLLWPALPPGTLCLMNSELWQWWVTVSRQKHSERKKPPKQLIPEQCSHCIWSWAQKNLKIDIFPQWWKLIKLIFFKIFLDLYRSESAPKSNGLSRVKHLTRVSVHPIISEEFVYSFLVYVLSWAKYARRHKIGKNWLHCPLSAFVALADVCNRIQNSHGRLVQSKP